MIILSQFSARFNPLALVRRGFRVTTSVIHELFQFATLNFQINYFLKINGRRCLKNAHPKYLEHEIQPKEFYPNVNQTIKYQPTTEEKSRSQVIFLSKQHSFLISISLLPAT
ncbi:hypothetical protein CEXT_11141 [Caerostris extrusa]|uniref:Uncharacterized protein n=1 Tax=Caerostris extrusa TaxID=172846 RepID=A0AAV4XGB3_CAEEX|nr:hypothetical protein CEXT_11141 [Caerostris extrusa]